MTDIEDVARGCVEQGWFHVQGQVHGCAYLSIAINRKRGICCEEEHVPNIDIVQEGKLLILVHFYCPVVHLTKQDEKLVLLFFFLMSLPLSIIPLCPENKLQRRLSKYFFQNLFSKTIVQQKNPLERGFHDQIGLGNPEYQSLFLDIHEAQIYFQCYLCRKVIYCF